jgi:type IV secretion system protein VirD4
VNERIKTHIAAASYLALLIVGVSSICTQFVAYRFAYNPALGNPLFARVYNPLDWWQWFQNYGGNAPEIYLFTFLLFIAGVLFSIFAVRLYIGLKTRSSRKHEGSHGTARFATFEDVEKTFLIHADEGVYCGGYYDEKSGRTLYLRHNGPEHVAAFAPTRSGKGVGLIIPTLLSWLESVVVLDIKGENYALTAGWRKKTTNNIVLRFEPANEFGSCSWNPLGEIRFGTRYQIRDAQNIALMVIDDDGKGIQGNHWRSAAFELLTGIILHALYKSPSVGDEPCLHDCANMLTGVGEFAAPEPNGEFDDGDTGALASLFDEMCNVELGADTAAQEAQLAIRSIGKRFSNTPPKELDSIISTANNTLSLYRDPIVGKNTSRSDFKIADLMDHDKPVSLYFITNPDDLVRMKPLARLLVTRIVQGLAGHMEFQDGRSRTNHKHRLLMMLDEFPALGKLEVFESALAYIAGYGIKAYIITQDVQQLYKAYSNHESIVSNCHVQLAYAPNKQETAEWLSKMCGQTTVIKEHISVSGKRFGGNAQNFSSSFQETQRPLMTPDEIKRLPMMHTTADAETPGEMLVFMAGHPVIKGRQTPYFLDPTFDKRSRIPPPQQSDVVRKGGHAQ